MSSPQPVLTVRHMSKTFPGQRALSDVSLDVQPGEVHALLGENGSGKSTFIKCLAGYHTPDHGAEVLLGGERLQLPYRASQAHHLGLSFIHQDLGLVPSLTVLENFALGRGFETGAGYRIRWGAEAKRARALLHDLGRDIRPDSLVRHLSRANQTLVAIARALQETNDQGRLLVLDEPTASLPEDEVHRLFDAVRQMTARGIGVIYVSHRLPEIFELAQRVSVLRDGALVGTARVVDLDERALIQMIIGRPLEEAAAPHEHSSPAPQDVLRVEHLSGKRVHNVSFGIGKGEVVGVAGLVGSGRSELGRLLFGAQRRRHGNIFLQGEPAELHDPANAIRQGVALVPEDRHGSGSIGRMTVGENITLPTLRRFCRFGRLNKRQERATVARLVEQFNVRPPRPGRRFYQLSGGNQQKAVLAKWLHLEPRLLVLDEPFQGVDIGAKEEIAELIDRAAGAGAGVLLISSDFDDLVQQSDRIIVMRNGTIVATLGRGEMRRERLTELVYTSTDQGSEQT